MSNTKKQNLKKKRQRQRLINTVLRIVLPLLAIIIVLGIVIHLVKNKSAEKTVNTNTEQIVDSDLSTTAEDESSIDTNIPDTVSDQSTAVSSISSDLRDSGAEDGSGEAGIMMAPDAMLEAANTQGWHKENNYRLWYSLGEGKMYYNGWATIDGCQYHFNAVGLADLGWKLIGGQSCYFDNSGTYIPDADNSKLLAFTFDDGPSQGMEEILALCEQTDSRVTFFMIGVQVENGGAVIPQIMDHRCELGNHSGTHTNMNTISTEECAANFQACDDWISYFSGGEESTVVRFPYGNYSSEETAAVNKPNIFWNVDTLDWESLNAESVINTTLEQITEGDIILMHDRHESTVEACRYLFPYLTSQGYQLVTVSELAAAKGIELQGGLTYFSFCNEDLANGTAFSQ